MKNCYVTSYNRYGPYWDRESVYVIDNLDGTWYVDGEYIRVNGERPRKVKGFMSAEDAQKVVDAIKYHFDNSKPSYRSEIYDPKPSYSYTEINSENFEQFKADLLSEYDCNAWAIDNFSQQQDADWKNRWIMQMIVRIDNAVAATEVV